VQKLVTLHMVLWNIVVTTHRW